MSYVHKTFLVKIKLINACQVKETAVGCITANNHLMFMTFMENAG